jgi:hypothetical protein
MITKTAYNVAAGLREARAASAADEEIHEGVLIAQARIADRFAKDNPNFDRRCFDLACDPDARTVSKPPE